MKPLEGKVKIAFALLLTLLFIIGIASYKNLLQLIENNRLATKNRVILKKLEIVLTKITDAETGQRGYIITGDERYLEPYHVAIATIDQEIKELRKLIVGNPNQNRKLDALEPLIAEKLIGLKERIDLRKNKGFEGAAQEVRSGKGRLVMDKMRKIISDMEDNERNLLEWKTAETEANARHTVFIVIFGSSLAFLIVGIASFITHREVIKHKQSDEALQKAYTELEQKVEDRTAELQQINESLQSEISERKEIEEKLRTASNEWRITFDSTSDLIMLLDREMNIIKANLATAKFFNKPINEILGKKCFQLFHGIDEPLATCPFEKMKNTKKHEEAEFYLSEKNIWLRTSVDPIFDDKGNITGSVHIVRDITDRKRAEEKLYTYQEQLRSLASQLSLLQEQERRRIAIDLHDHISQTLALCKIKLGILQESASSDLTKSLDEIRNLIEQSIQYTRSFIFELSPPILYELGFETAVEWLGEQILKKHGILFYFKDDRKPKPIGNETRIILFQVMRELLMNIAKHAHADKASISICKDGDSIRIHIEDDGVGFDVSKIDTSLNKTVGFGFFSIRERLNYIGGQIEIKSEPGHGTRVTVVAPLKIEK
jgi:PAS domain S-box-containing protein